MPSRKPRRVKTLGSPKVVVTLATTERVKVAQKLLEIASPAERAPVTRDLDRLLGIWASQLANVRNVSLRSDFLSRAEPLVERVRTLWAVMQREGDLLSVAAFKGFVDLDVLKTQLEGFPRLAAWLKEEKTKGGGERRSFRKQVNDEWKAQTRAWFDRHAPAMSAKERTKRQSALVRLAQTAVERALSRS